MAGSERQGDSTRIGVGTMTRSGIRPRPRQAPEEAPAANPRRGRPAPVPTQRPTTGQQPDPRSSGQNAGPRAADRRQRVPSQSAPAQRPAAEQRTGAGAQRADASPAVAAPARPAPRPRTGPPWRVPPAKRVTGPQPAVPPNLGQPGQRAEPGPAGPITQPPKPSRPQTAAAAVANSGRMPFVLLLCGLLGGALVSALVISTTLAEGSYQITNLQNSTSALAQQRQTLVEEVAQAQSPTVIEQRASQLGMRRTSELWFLDLKTGKVTNDGPTWIGAVNAPGYAP
jgi:hypothetical protein